MTAHEDRMARRIARRAASLFRNDVPADTYAVPACSGVLTDGHDADAQTAEYRIGARTVALCPPCADAAGRLGLVERRIVSL